MSLAPIGFAALLLMVPAIWLSLRGTAISTAAVRVALPIAVAGPVLWVWQRYADGWHPGLPETLALSVAATLALYYVLTLTTASAWKIGPILLPYQLLVGIVALMLGMAERGSSPMVIPGPALFLHIAVAVTTYALLTLAAVAALAVTLKERALKRRNPGGFAALLPSVAEVDSLQGRLLLAATGVLGIGLLSGAVTGLAIYGTIAFDHKAVLSILGFGVLMVLLLLMRRTGLRGKRAARLSLVAYLLLFLAYIGVKFVTEILLGRSPV